jgi:hypothetical protein
MTEIGCAQNHIVAETVAVGTIASHFVPAFR